MFNKMIFLKVYFSKLFQFLGVVLTGQLLFSFSFNQPYEKSDFLVSFICSLLYMTSCRQKVYDETIRLTEKYNGLIYKSNKLDDINEN